MRVTTSSRTVGSPLSTRCTERTATFAVIANVRYNVQRLQQATPILADMVEKKQIRVVGAVHDLATGKVTLV